MEILMHSTFFGISVSEPKQVEDMYEVGNAFHLGMLKRVPVVLKIRGGESTGMIAAALEKRSIPDPAWSRMVAYDEQTIDDLKRGKKLKLPIGFTTKVLTFKKI